METSPQLQEMLELQLSEVEMLSSMFPGADEFTLDDPGAVAVVQSYVDNKITYSELNSRISFTIRVSLNECKDEEKNLEVACQFPHEYPSVPPDVFLRAARISKASHSRLNEQLDNYIQELDRGEICIYPMILWLQEHAGKYMQDSCNSSDSSIVKCAPTTDVMFSRIWIYSHHIYSKVKRKDILEYSQELSLSGFCMPGKPGVICIEGIRCNAEEFWHRIRRMTWKKIGMKHREDMPLGDNNADGLRCFQGFEEKYFEPRQGKGRGVHMDRGLLFNFLEKSGCGKVFPILFGVEGKVTAESDSY